MTKTERVTDKDIRQALDAFVEAKRKEFGSYAYATGFLISLVTSMSNNISNEARQTILNQLKSLTK